jgi:hypothetical protein
MSDRIGSCAMAGWSDRHPMRSTRHQPRFVSVHRDVNVVPKLSCPGRLKPTRSARDGGAPGSDGIRERASVVQLEFLAASSAGDTDNPSSAGYNSMRSAPASSTCASASLCSCWRSFATRPLPAGRPGGPDRLNAADPIGAGADGVDGEPGAGLPPPAGLRSGSRSFSSCWSVSCAAARGRRLLVHAASHVRPSTADARTTSASSSR